MGKFYDSRIRRWIIKIVTSNFMIFERIYHGMYLKIIFRYLFVWIYWVEAFIGCQQNIYSRFEGILKLINVNGVQL